MQRGLALRALRIAMVELGIDQFERFENSRTLRVVAGTHLDVRPRRDQMEGNAERRTICHAPFHMDDRFVDLQLGFECF